MLDKERIRMSVLIELYGCLLTERQLMIVHSSVDDDLSLAEISELTGITRQGVRDSIKKSEEELERYESSLGLYEKYLARQSLAEEIIDSLPEQLPDSAREKIVSLLGAICE
ncbi:MAG: DNA-binding protein [Clostridia bacterium]|nr:DNA-binding protein [Clostridia bacterium]